MLTRAHGPSLKERFNNFFCGSFQLLAITRVAACASRYNQAGPREFNYFSPLVIDAEIDDAIRLGGGKTWRRTRGALSENSSVAPSLTVGEVWYRQPTVLCGHRQGLVEIWSQMSIYGSPGTLSATLAAQRHSRHHRDCSPEVGFSRTPTTLIPPPAPPFLSALSRADRSIVAHMRPVLIATTAIVDSFSTARR